VYGGTPSGIMAAVAAARHGAQVCLLEPTRHVGGMVASGLSVTDIGNMATIGGYALEFFKRIAVEYQAGKGPVWNFEPHIAEKVFIDLLNEAGVDVFLSSPLREDNGVIVDQQAIVQVITARGRHVSAKVFIDSGYEGDLMASAGVTFTWGRESVSQYGESLAGVILSSQFDVNIHAYDGAGQLLPDVGVQPRGNPGSGDQKSQAYNFRLSASSDPLNSVPFPKPQDYDPKRYAILAKLIAGRTQRDGQPPALDTLLRVSEYHHHKADINNSGPYSTDVVGSNWGYPNSTYSQRAQMRSAYVNYTAGLLYYLANDEQVPAILRQALGIWGLAKDEFTDNGNWPYQLYVREGRRMIGSFVLTQKDVQTDLSKSDSIGVGSYNIDSHSVQRFIDANGNIQNEGLIDTASKPYEIPYRVMLPTRSDPRNLLVSVCVSSSHVAFSSLRVETVYMTLGQAAGTAASRAAVFNTDMRDIDVAALQQVLSADGSILNPPRQTP